MADQTDSYGITAEHPAVEARAFRVAPSSGSTTVRNTVRPVDFPAACWRIEDICFDFASVFLRPEAWVPFKALAKIWSREKMWGKPPRLALFGHADPVDKDRFNKRLSEDRAKVVYGVLVRDEQVWKEVFVRRDQVEDLQNGLIGVNRDMYNLGHATGAFDGNTTTAIKQYMDDLCPGLVLDKTSDFLLGGDAAYQGCGEFNPLIVFSKKQRAELNRPHRRAERDIENRPNRRVVGLIWRGDAPAGVKNWPCKPAAKGLGPCKTMFWRTGVPGDKRRQPWKYGRRWLRNASPTAAPPPTSSAWTYTGTRNTFACREYHELVAYSPCEIAKPPTQEWRILLTAFENTRLAKPPRRFTMGCAFHFQFVITLTTEKDKPGGNWLFKRARIHSVHARIDPYYDPGDVILLGSRYGNKRNLMSLQGQSLPGKVDRIAGQRIKGLLDRNLQRYAGQADALYVQFTWPRLAIPTAEIKWKLNTTLKEARWWEYDKRRDIWIEAVKDLTASTITTHMADNVLKSEITIDHMLPLSDGTLHISREQSGVSFEGIRWKNTWLRIRYDIKRLGTGP